MKAQARKKIGESNFFGEVYKITNKIPPGFVTTYGSIASYLGTRDSRKIGWALHANKDVNIPCHRVVNKEGGVAKSYSFGGGDIQRQKLEEEGVTFKSKEMVDLEKHFWDVR